MANAECNAASQNDVYQTHSHRSMRPFIHDDSSILLAPNLPCLDTYCRCLTASGNVSPRASLLKYFCACVRICVTVRDGTKSSSMENRSLPTCSRPLRKHSCSSFVHLPFKLLRPFNLTNETRTFVPEATMNSRREDAC